MTLSELTSPSGFPCSCGKTHACSVDKIICRSGAIDDIPAVVKSYSSKKPFVLCDKNTYSAAGEKVCRILQKEGIEFSLFILPEDKPAPDEHTVGSAVMHFDLKADMVIAGGSGVVNDTGKILAAMGRLPYCIVATAPSMDGYASATSSMERGGLKVSLPSAPANVIIGDTDVLKNAPLPMLISGLGDMLAKYVSVCEWRIAAIVTGEYYCEFVAGLVRSALEKCVSAAEGLLKREDEAVEAVFEGLCIGGLAMTFAGLSRPASGVEHYLSHVWDMRALEFGTPSDSHGTQCALGTLISVKLYEELVKHSPKSEKARAFAESFNKLSHFENLKKLLGSGAEVMIRQDDRERKYAPEGHTERLSRIVSRWDDILAVIGEELPSSADLEALMNSVGLPVSPEALGVEENIDEVFRATKDIRDKYVLSRLIWDLGLEDEIYPSKIL